VISISKNIAVEERFIGIDMGWWDLHNQRVNVYFLPKTFLGRCSWWLIVAFILLVIAFELLAAVGQRGGETFLDNLALAIPIFLAGICGICSFITGAIGIFKSKDRSILVFLSTLLGLFVLIILVGEIAIPH
jgi:hypothetical protein